MQENVERIPSSETPQRSAGARVSTRFIRWSLSLMGAAAVVAFILCYPPAFELALETSKIVFALLSTPFILEGFFIILGFVIVISLNNRRLAKETADEWVYLDQTDVSDLEFPISSADAVKPEDP